MPTLRTLADLALYPSRGLASAAESRSIAPPLLAATLASLLFAALLVPRLDAERAVDARLDKDPEAAQMTPREREEAVLQGRRVMGIVAYAGAAAGPAGAALGAALSLFLAFRVAGSRPPFLPTLAVASWSLLPGQLRTLLAIPALLRSTALLPDAVEGLLPASAAALLPPGASGPGPRVLSALDLFALWSLALLVLGMAGVAGVSRARAASVVAILWLAYVAFSRVVLPAVLA